MKDRILQYSLGYYEDESYGITLGCEQLDLLKSVEFYIDDQWYEFRRNDYLIDIGDSYQC